MFAANLTAFPEKRHVWVYALHEIARAATRQDVAVYVALIIVLAINPVGFVGFLATVMARLTDQTGNVRIHEIDFDAITFGAILDGLDFGIRGTKVP